PPFSPKRSAERIKLPKGFKATLFAGEPDIIKPIAMTLDDRGRLWVVESHCYPNWIDPKSETPRQTDADMQFHRNDGKVNDRGRLWVVESHCYPNWIDPKSETPRQTDADMQFHRNDGKVNDRGRLWVVESHSYPNWLPEGKQGRDRILIFEDKKGSGHFDS